LQARERQHSYDLNMVSKLRISGFEAVSQLSQTPTASLVRNKSPIVGKSPRSNFELNFLSGHLQGEAHNTQRDQSHTLQHLSQIQVDLPVKKKVSLKKIQAQLVQATLSLRNALSVEAEVEQDQLKLLKYLLKKNACKLSKAKRILSTIGLNQFLHAQPDRLQVYFLSVSNLEDTTIVAQTSSFQLIKKPLLLS